MQLWLLACIAVFGAGTLATKIDIGATEGGVKNELVSCLFSVIETVCPFCTRSVSLVIPTKSSPGADSLAKSFNNLASIHGITIDVADGPHIENTLSVKYRIFLINTKADLTWFVDNFTLTKHKVHQVFLLNYDVGPHLEEDLQDVLPATWYGCDIWSIIFVASSKDEFYTYSRTPRGFSTCTRRSLKRLRFCNSKTPGGHGSPLKDTITTHLYKNSSLTVVVIPSLKPYIREQTDNPGGVVGNLMNAVKDKFSITVKYDWAASNVIKPGTFMIKDPSKIIFDMLPVPRKFSDMCSLVFLNMDEAKWIFVSLESAPSNFLKGLGGEGFYWHLVLFLIFSAVTAFIVTDPDKIKIVVRLFGMFLGLAVGWFPKKALGRWMVLLWCLTSYITVQAYLAMLTSNLSLLSRSNPISGLSSIVENEIDVFCTPVLRQHYCNFNDKTSIYLCNKCQTLPHLWQERLDDAMKNKSTSLRPFAFSSSLMLQKSNVGRHDHFYFTNDKVGMWPVVLHTHYQAVDHMQMITSRTFWRLWEAGIIEFWSDGLEMKRKSDYNLHDKEIQNEYGKLLSSILYLGYILSCLVFLIEILVHKYWKNEF